MQHISLIANGWLVLHEACLVRPAILDTAEAPRQLLSIENHITPMNLPVLSRTFAKKASDLYSYSLYSTLRHETAARLHERITANLPEHDILRTSPAADLYAEKMPLCVVDSNKGKIAFPVDFDALANAFLLASQGALVEITLTTSPCPTTATIDVRKPAAIAGIKRSIPLTPKSR